jgi:hypothetical protein
MPNRWKAVVAALWLFIFAGIGAGFVNLVVVASGAGAWYNIVACGVGFVSAWYFQNLLMRIYACEDFNE